MLINYFDNSSMLTTYPKKLRKAMIERIYWVVSFQKNVKRVSYKILEGNSKFWKLNRIDLFDEHDHSYFWPHLHQTCFASNFMGKVVDWTISNISEPEELC